MFGTPAPIFAFAVFMKFKCPKCKSTGSNLSKNGFFKRSSDSRKIQRLRCKKCGKHFSYATFSDCYLQKKRKLNHLIRKDLCSSTSMRRIAINHGISRTTVKRKLKFLSSRAQKNHQTWLKKRTQKFDNIYLDDLESFEETKYKPLTVSMFVENKTRKIIGFKVAPIGAKGSIKHMADKKYGLRENISSKKRSELFKELKNYLDEKTLFTTDMHKDYSSQIKRHFPLATHIQHKSQRGSLTAQGELKRIGRDPLFYINQVFAMMRDNIKRLARKTWCHTKQLKFLEQHIHIYVDFHNSVLLNL